MNVHPPKSKDKPATYADIEAAPEHLVAEIINGELLTHPRPSFRHGRAATALAGALNFPFQKGVGGPGGWVFVIEPEIKLGPNIVVPDIAGWRNERLVEPTEANYIEVAPDWLCEVLSASTEKRDRTIKMRVYANAAIPHIWLVDPRLQILEVFELRDGVFAQISAWNSADEVRAPPFEVITFSLADLWPLDKPLGLNEDPTPYFAGDR